MQLKRCFLSIHQGMLNPPFITMPDNENAMKLYWTDVALKLDRTEYLAGALALEIAPKTGTLHIQGYLEHKRKRLTTLASDLDCNLQNGISVVKDAQGSWNYCAGLGEHKMKPAVARITWGEPKLHGSAEKTDLKVMVQAIIDGATPDELLKANPYAWAVHRDRLIKFYQDWIFGVFHQPAEWDKPPNVGPSDSRRDSDRTDEQI